MSFFVRTGSGGANVAVLIEDLGIFIQSGAGWTELTAGTASSPSGGNGQFTAVELRDSADLYNLIKASSLEVSSNGATNNISAGAYTSDMAVLANYTDDTVVFAAISADTMSVDGYDFTNHFDGGAGKHNASEIDIEGSYSFIPGTPTNLEAAIAAIDTALSTAGSSGGSAFTKFIGDSGTVAVADIAADTLTVAGSGSIATVSNAGSDTVTISGDALLPRDGSRAATASIDLGSQKIINLAAPTNPNDAVNKQYVDSVATGLDVKQSVVVATVANITLFGIQSIDGIILNSGDRVLVKNQTNAAENGIYVVGAGTWVRSADADGSTEFTSGLFVFVELGGANSDSGWVLSTDGVITLGTTNLIFSQFSSAGVVNAGAGLTSSGTTIDVVGTVDRIAVFSNNVDIASTYVGQTSITTVGTINAGTWNATAISATKGGTGLNGSTAGNGTLLIGNGGGFTLSTITSGTAITATPGSGSITVNHSQVSSGDLHTEYLKADGSRAITGNIAISGVATFSPSVSTDPAVVIVPDSIAPTTNVVDGAITLVGGIMYIYDGGRSKWLSVDRKILQAAKSGYTKDIYLRLFDGIASSSTGYRAMRNGTITGAVGQTDGVGTWALQIMKNGTQTIIASLAFSSVSGAQSTVIDTNFSVGDVIQFYANTSGGTITSPIVGIEIAWRI